MDTWDYEVKHYRALFRAVTGRETVIYPIPENENELGYTTRACDIHIARSHPVMEGLEDAEKMLFREGVFAHEMCHQLFTDFVSLENTLSGIRHPGKRKVVGLFHNLVEDPAIEYAAPEAFGGELLQALRFSIRWIYEKSPEIGKAEDAFSQLVAALVHFGDIGIVKGTFTFDSAREHFIALAPSFYATILEPDPGKRVEAAVKWAEETQPLWGPLYEEDRDAFDKMYSRAASMSSRPSESRSAPIFRAEDRVKNRSDNTAADRREEALRALRSEEGGENAFLETVSAQEKEANAAARREGEKEADAERKAVKALSRGAKEHKSSEQKREAMESLDVRVRGGKGRVLPTDCLNTYAEAPEDGERAYRAACARLAPQAAALKRECAKIFALDYDRKIRATSGRYNITRAAKHESVKIFDRRREARDVADIAVLLLVDESGSMHTGKKIETARDTAIILAEAFAALHVPCAVVGFTADGTASAEHRHYVSWKNTPAERVSLMGMQARINNNDGYSIRYASAYLSKRKNRYKFLFVISDGLPVCRVYPSEVAAVQDTAAAIVEAKRLVNVIGIGIQILDEDAMRTMYGGSCVFIKNVKTLPAVLAKQLRAQIARLV